MNKICKKKIHENQPQKKLNHLKNVGPATLKDLHLLGIHSIEELASCDATELFQKLERLAHKRQDPCVWDVFAAIIHEAKTGEASVWWKWTAQRKKLQQQEKPFHVM